MKEKKLRFIAKNDTILKYELENCISRKFYRRIKFLNGQILVNGIPRKNHEEIKQGDLIEILVPEEEKEFQWPLYESQLEVLFENEHYLVVNKRSNLLTIPTRQEPKSLYQEAAYYLKQNEIHILNRLDKQTKGLVVIAKDRYAAYRLQPTHRHMVRKYLCLVHGIVKESGHIENYIAKEEHSNKRYITEDSKKGQISISDYRIIRTIGENTLLEFILQTGRTHQIRVHTSAMGHPIVGDAMYGREEAGDLQLVSYQVIFKDPFTDEQIDIKIDIRW